MTDTLTTHSMTSNQSGEIVMYQPDETIRLEVRMGEDTVWLSANQMALLFDRDEKTVRKHINNVFSEGELPKDINTHFLRVDGVNVNKLLIFEIRYGHFY